MAGPVHTKVYFAGPSEFIVHKFQNRRQHEKPVPSNYPARTSGGKGDWSVK